MSQDIVWPLLMLMRAKECADYWKEFEVQKHRLVLTRYKEEDIDKRSRYSLFVFRGGDSIPERCFNFEPDDFEGAEPVAFFGEHSGYMHANKGKAPNELTIEQFQPIAFEWVAKLLNIKIQDISPLRKEHEKHDKQPGAQATNSKISIKNDLPISEDDLASLPQQAQLVLCVSAMRRLLPLIKSFRPALPYPTFGIESTIIITEKALGILPPDFATPSPPGFTLGASPKLRSLTNYIMLASSILAQQACRYESSKEPVSPKDTAKLINAIVTAYGIACDGRGLSVFLSGLMDDFHRIK